MRNSGLTLMICAACLGLWLTTTGSAQETRPLSFGRAQEGVLKASEQHVYQLSLAAGEFARVEVEIAEPDLSLHLLDAAGQPYYQLDFDSQLRRQVVFYAQADAMYQIRLSADASRTTTSGYRLRWLEKRPATEPDKAAAAAQQTDYEAVALYNRNTPEAVRQSVEKCRTAAQLYELGGARDRVGVMFNLMGMGLHLLNERAASEQAYLQAVAIFRQLNLRDGENGALDNLARLCATFGDYQSALEYAGQKQIQAQQLSDPVVRMMSLNSLAMIYRRSGDLPRALGLYLEAASVAQTSRQFFYVRIHEAQTLLGLGMIYCALDDETQGLSYLGKGIRAYQEVGHLNSPQIPQALSEQAKIYLRRGAAHTALDLLTPLLADERTQALQRATIQTRLGQAYLALKRHDQAKKAFAEAETLSQTNGYQDLLIESGFGLTQVAHARQKLSEAIALGEKTIAIIEQQQARIHDAMLRATLFASQRAVYELQIELLMQQSEQTPARRRELQAAALHLSERGRARALLNLLNNSALPANAVARQKQLREKIETTAAELSRTPLSDQARRDELNRALTVLTTELNLQYTANNRKPDATNLASALTLTELQQQVLDDKTLLLEFALGAECSYLFAATSTGLQTFALPPRAEIEQKARAWYQLMESYARPPAFKSVLEMQQWKKSTQQKADAVAAQLSRILLAPARALLADKRLLIVPDGALHYVPFAALPVVRGQLSVARKQAKNNGQRTPDNRPPLIVHHELLTLPSASRLALQRRRFDGRALAPKMLALLADPIFSNNDPRLVSKTRDGNAGTKTQWLRLPATRQEAEAVMPLVPAESRMIALDFAANLATATSPEMSQYRHVHFATHGLFDNEHPELSSLVFSQRDEKGAAQNGYLRTMDVFNLKLNAELVVLSGCRTGLGKEVNGEGLLGLTHGFMSAGARRVMASLWQVSDVATAELMRRFYQGLLGERKLSPAAALRAAQLEMMKDPRYSAPYYWAAFTLQGEW